MSCESTFPTDGAEYIRYFRKLTATHNIPARGTIELTRRCNLSCVHCYATPHLHRGERARQEMDIGVILDILDQLTDAGCLSLLLTGGEPLLRPDFAAIYAHAVNKGLMVTVFTNATMLTEETVALFKDLPPRQVEISLYGASERICATVTGVKGALARTLNGIELLKEAGIRTGLKTVLMKPNQEEFEQIQAIAEHYGLPFRMDAGLFPKFENDQEPLSMRVPPAEAVAKEFSSPSRAKKFSDYYRQRKHLSCSNELYDCGAATTSFSIDPYGNLQPCLMTSQPSFDLTRGSFADGWKQIARRNWQSMLPPESACRGCDNRLLCGFCPSFAKLETGRADQHSDYMCSIGLERRRAIDKLEIELNLPTERS